MEILKTYLTPTQLKSIEHVTGYARSNIHMSIKCNNYLPRMTHTEIEIVAQKVIDEFLAEENKKKEVQQYETSCKNFNIHIGAFGSAGVFFKEQKEFHRPVPGMGFTVRTLHKKYKKQLFKFAIAVQKGEIKKIDCAPIWNWMPTFISFLNKKYNKKIIYIN